MQTEKAAMGGNAQHLMGSETKVSGHMALGGHGCRAALRDHQQRPHYTYPGASLPGRFRKPETAHRPATILSCLGIPFEGVQCQTDVTSWLWKTSEAPLSFPGSGRWPAGLWVDSHSSPLGSFLGEQTKDALKTGGYRPNPAWYKTQNRLTILTQRLSTSSYNFREEGFSLPVKTQSK